MRDKAKSYEAETDICQRIISLVIGDRPFQKELGSLVANFWNRINGKPYKYEELHVDLLEDESMQMAVLRVSSAIELMKYEPTYEKVNCSTAVRRASACGLGVVQA